MNEHRQRSPATVEGFQVALALIARRIDRETDAECLQVLLVGQADLLKGLSDLPYAQTNRGFNPALYEALQTIGN